MFYTFIIYNINEILIYVSQRGSSLDLPISIKYMIGSKNILRFPITKTHENVVNINMEINPKKKKILNKTEEEDLETKFQTHMKEKLP